MFRKCILVLALLALTRNEKIKTYHYRPSTVSFPNSHVAPILYNNNPTAGPAASSSTVFESPNKLTLSSPSNFISSSTHITSGSLLYIPLPPQQPTPYATQPTPKQPALPKTTSQPSPQPIDNPLPSNTVILTSGSLLGNSFSGANNIITGSGNSGSGSSNLITGVDNNCHGNSNAIEGSTNSVDGSVNQIIGSANSIDGNSNLVIGCNNMVSTGSYALTVPV